MGFVVIRNFLNSNLLLQKTKTNYNEYLVDGSNGLYGLKLLEKIFFEEKLQEQYDYLCFVDEDCLCKDIENVINILDKTDFDIAGVPDGDCIQIRKHRPDVPNLFFTVIKTKKLKNISHEEYKSYCVSHGASGKNFNFDSFEPYYKFFCYIIYDLNCRFFKLNAKDSKLDGITTEFFLDGSLIGIHTWYSRIYQQQDTKNRIDSAIDFYKTKLFSGCKINLPFEKVYCLHLAEATERQNSIQSEFARLGIDDKVEIWWTCKHPKSKECAVFLLNTHQYWWNGYGNGAAFNCTREHYQMIKTAYLRGVESICLIEDDVVFIDDVNLLKNIFNNIPKDYDIIRFVYTPTEQTKGIIDNSGEYFVEDYRFGFWGTLMYALSRKGMEYYISFMDGYYSVADGPLYSASAITNASIKHYVCKYNITKPDTFNNESYIQK